MHRRGVRHRLTGILGLALCAVDGRRRRAEPAPWAERARAVPSESTFRRTLQRLDADAFDYLGAAGDDAGAEGAARVIAVTRRSQVRTSSASW